MPYVRGHLYFANLDSQIRAASHGRRNLDIVLRELFVRRESGETFDRDAWIRVVTDEVGADAARQFEDVVLKGETIVPAPDAFGPCFGRRPAELAIDDETVEGYEWTRKGSIANEQCRETT